jgi:hypothetical protein
MRAPATDDAAEGACIARSTSNVVLRNVCVPQRVPAGVRTPAAAPASSRALQPKSVAASAGPTSLLASSAAARQNASGRKVTWGVNHITITRSTSGTAASTASGSAQAHSDSYSATHARSALAVGPAVPLQTWPQGAQRGAHTSEHALAQGSGVALPEGQQRGSHLSMTAPLATSRSVTGWGAVAAGAAMPGAPLQGMAPHTASGLLPSAGGASGSGSLSAAGTATRAPRTFGMHAPSSFGTSGGLPPAASAVTPLAPHTAPAHLLAAAPAATAPLRHAQSGPARPGSPPVMPHLHTAAPSWPMSIQRARPAAVPAAQTRSGSLASGTHASTQTAGRLLQRQPLAHSVRGAAGDGGMADTSAASWPRSPADTAPLQPQLSMPHSASSSLPHSAAPYDWQHPPGLRSDAVRAPGGAAAPQPPSSAQSDAPGSCSTLRERRSTAHSSAPGEPETVEGGQGRGGFREIGSGELRMLLNSAGATMDGSKTAPVRTRAVVRTIRRILSAHPVEWSMD